MQQANPSWRRTAQLGIGANVDLPMGGENGTITIVPTAGYKYLTFGFRYSTVVTLTISIGIDTVTMLAQHVLAGVAATWMTPYDLVSPIGDSGFISVNAPYIRLNLTNGAVGTAGIAVFWANLTN